MIAHYGLLLFWMMAAHALCDYPLQGDFLARGKNHRQPLAGISWWQCLYAHALIHAGAVALITGVPALGLIEFGLHSLIDYGKCSEWYGFNFDQALHWACKFLYVALLAGGLFR
jgi:hypothetical protein